MEGSDTDNRVRIGFGLGLINRPDGQVIDRQRLSGGQLGGRMSREAEAGMGADDAACFDRRQVILTDVKPQAEQRRVIGAIVQDEIGLDLRAGLEGGNEVAGEITLMPDLNPGSAAIDGGLKDILERMVMKLRGVEDRVKRHYSCMGA